MQKIRKVPPFSPQARRAPGWRMSHQPPVTLGGHRIGSLQDSAARHSPCALGCAGMKPCTGQRPGVTTIEAPRIMARWSARSRNCAVPTGFSNGRMCFWPRRNSTADSSPEGFIDRHRGTFGVGLSTPCGVSTRTGATLRPDPTRGAGNWARLGGEHAGLRCRQGLAAAGA